MKQYFSCEDDLKEIMFTSPWLLIVLADIILWALANKLPIKITSILRPENDGISVSKTHQEGRAIDLSVSEWSDDQIDELCDYLNEKYVYVGAISGKTKKPLLCYYHNSGHGWHFHIQVRPLEFIKGVSLCLKQ